MTGGRMTGGRMTGGSMTGGSMTGGSMNLVFCERYGTKFTAAACKKFRENTPYRCSGCDGPVPCDANINTTRVIKISEHKQERSVKVNKKTAKVSKNTETTEKAEKTEKTEKKPRICSVDGCDRKYLAKGLCQKHYYEKREKEKRESKKTTAAESPATKQLGSLPVETPTTKTNPQRADPPWTGTNPQRTKTKKKKTNNSIYSISLSFFERDRELLDSVLESAERNRRTLTAEILYRLDCCGLQS